MSALNAIFEFISNPKVQMVLIIANPIMGYIGGYFAGRTHELKIQADISHKRVKQMIEDRKNGVLKSNAQGNSCWYD